MRHLDLYSGIGGFALAARWMGWRTVAFCELEPFCQRVLRRHWPDVPIHSDIRELHCERDSADIITGGFPCQDISSAGPRGGIDGPRSSLWREYARLIGEVRPRFAVVENVAALTARGLYAVLGDLAALGYDALWDCLPACAVGAPHTRDRLFILAYPTGSDGQERIRARAAGLGALSSRGYREVRRDWLERVARNARGGSGIPDRVDRTRAIGNSVVPQVAHEIFKLLSSGDSAT